MSGTQAITIIDEANVPPSSDAPDVFSGKLSFAATAAGTRRPATAQHISSGTTTWLLINIGRELSGFPLFLQSAGIALFVLDFWYFSSGKSTERK